MKVKLKCSLISVGSHYFLSGRKNFQLPPISDTQTLSFLHQLAEGLSFELLAEYLKNGNCRQLYTSLKKESLLNAHEEFYLNSSLEKTYEFLSYHLGDVNVPFTFREDLHVAIIGCGGTGANVALCLASSGFANFSLVDFDDVQSSNLNRQFAYDGNDVGKSKVTCLRNKLHRINTGLKISAYEKEITDSSDLDFLSEDVDLIVSAIDHPAVHGSVYTLKYAIGRNIPIIFGAVGYDRISAGPLLTPQAARKSYLKALETIRNIDTQPVTGSISSTNLTLSAMLATNITAWFYPFDRTDLQNVRKIYNPATMTVVSEVSYGDN